MPSTATRPPSARTSPPPGSGDGVAAETGAAEAERGARAYLRLADRLLPGRIAGFYLVGSAALGDFRPGRSDIDFVAVVDGEPAEQDLRRLRALHLVAGLRSGVAAARRGWSPATNTCNGVFVRQGDLGKPVSQIVPVASHSGPHFAVARGFDVNPAMWKEFADHGVPLRGPAPPSLALDPEPGLLRKWCLDNLSSYWQSWAEAALVRGRHSGRRSPRWAVAWATLGPPRLHRTIAHGDIISKEAAGNYALEIFDVRWHPVIQQGLAYRRGETSRLPVPASRDAVRAAAAFVLEVVGSAQTL